MYFVPVTVPRWYDHRCSYIIIINQHIPCPSSSVHQAIRYTSTSTTTTAGPISFLLLPVWFYQQQLNWTAVVDSSVVFVELRSVTVDGQQLVSLQVANKARRKCWSYGITTTGTLSRYKEINLCTVLQESLLLHTARNSLIPILLLVRYDADVNLGREHDNYTPLIACSSGSKDLLTSYQNTVQILQLHVAHCCSFDDR